MASIIPQETLDEILNRLDPVSFISEFVPLKKSGKDYKGLCPFHQEKTPSFMVSPEKRIFYCFGCGQGGNLFSFIMKLEHLTFPEAATRLAERAGVTLSKETSRDPDLKDTKEIFYRINRYAAWFFAEQLKKNSQNLPRKYLMERGIEPPMWQEYHLGYAPDEWESLIQFLKEKRVPLDLAET